MTDLPDALTLFRRHSQPLEARPTGEAARLGPLPEVRAVVFDIYGTLILSGVGDISLAGATQQEGALREAFGELGLTFAQDPGPLTPRFRGAIEAQQAQLRAAGTDCPEVEIREVWQALVEELVEAGALGGPVPPQALEALAVAYEVRANPVWPMPGLEATLQDLRARGFGLGIVSNAQFYTPLMFPAFLERDLDALGFPPGHCQYSFAHRVAKPSTALYERLVEAMDAYAPHELLFVGNDRRNDVWPAARVGMKTALFAGDARSLRWREDDPRLEGVTPDVVLTDLRQLGEVLPHNA